VIPIITLFGLPIYTYPLVVGFSWGLASNLFMANFIGTEKYKGYFYLASLFLLSWVGAKLFFWVFSGELNQQLLQSKNFWLGGGFVFYGGLILGFLWTIFYFFIFPRNIKLEIIKELIPLLVLGHAVGRIACILAGCCFGILLKSPLHLFGHEISRQPVPFYESLFLFFLYFILRRYKAELNTKILMLSYTLSYATFRFLIEFLRGDKIRGLYSHLSSSQWISLTIIVVSLIFASYARRDIRNQKPC